MHSFRGNRDHCDRYPPDICPPYHRHLTLCVYQLTMYENRFIFYVNTIAQDWRLQRLFN
jgi:hypothetical protein